MGDFKLNHINNYIKCKQTNHANLNINTRWKKVYHANGKQENCRALLILGQVNLKANNITRGNEGHFTVVTRTIYNQQS